MAPFIPPSAKPAPPGAAPTPMGGPMRLVGSLDPSRGMMIARRIADSFFDSSLSGKRTASSLGAEKDVVDELRP